MLLLAASIFFARPLPLDMPWAHGYLVSEHGVARFEDRYLARELWESSSVDGRWFDDEGRLFIHCTLSSRPPEHPDDEVTRVRYRDLVRPIKRRDAEARRDAIDMFTDAELPEKPSKPRSLPRGYRAVEYYHGTNTSEIVCAYLTEKSDTWRLAIRTLLEGDDFADALEEFEEEFLVNPPTEPLPRLPEPTKKADERELHRADARRSIAAYPTWHFTDSPEFAVLDDLPTRALVTAFTNDFTRLRRRFREVMPSELDPTNQLVVVRIYADRDEYLDALELSGETNLTWSAAYWSQSRREIVAYAPDNPLVSSDDELLRTLRHECFHQYLAYATAMISAYPWLNEGYAQYFEDEDSLDWKLDHRPTAEELETYARFLPSVFMMDYDDFYAGTPEVRRLKYRLAWSIAVFLEKGAPKLRFQPFRNLKRDYLEALNAHAEDPRPATLRAFGSAEKLEKFVAEWLLYWKSRP